METTSESELYFYNTYTTPWPAKDRDAISHIFIEQKNNDFVTIKFEAAPEYLEEKDGFVRVQKGDNSNSFLRAKKPKSIKGNGKELNFLSETIFARENLPLARSPISGC